MNAYSDELRLAWVVLLNIAVVAAAYRLARRCGAGGMVQAICDAFLLYFLVQYVAVGLPGICGILTAGTMSAMAIVMTVGMWFGANLIGATHLQGRDSTLSRFTPGTSDSEAPDSGAPESGASLSLVPGVNQFPRKTAEVEMVRGSDPTTTARITGVPPVRESQGVERLAHSQEAPIPHGRGAGVTWDFDHLALLACALFTVAYLLAHAYVMRPIPPIATDALVYHLPTAVQWIQTHRLGTYPTWYWNPAASYSPATGSMFMYWWMAPADNDVFVRYVQLPALLFIFFIVARMCRRMGCSRAVAGLIAVAATLSRPLFSETVVPKDDLYVTAFVAAAVLSLARAPIRERFGAWRVGIALALVLASKYTVLLACPLFLFMIDAPFRARWRWRHAMVVIAMVCLLALPWYFSNIALTGNPLYPVDVRLPGLTLRGLFGTERDQQLRSAAGVWHMLSSTYHSMPVALIVALVTGWAFCLIVAGRSVLRDPLSRACVLGSALTWMLFLAASPHHEVRYLFPLMVLAFAGIGLGLARRRVPNGRNADVATVLSKSPRETGTPGDPSSFTPGQALRRPGFFGLGMNPGRRTACPGVKEFPQTTIPFRWGDVLTNAALQMIAAAAIAILSVATTFDSNLIALIAAHAAFALVIASLGVGLVLLQTRVLHLGRDRIALLAGAGIVVLALAAYTQWHAYVQEYQRDRFEAWQAGYPHHAPLWKWVDENLPADASIAYANTFFVYPYAGFNFTRHVVYAPISEGLHDFLHVPRLGDRVPGDLIVRRMTEVMDTHPDRATWIENLTQLGAQYLIVMKPSREDRDLDPNPPELHFARQDPQMFDRMYEDDAGIVFHIR